tara:strand:- start:18931 stop:19371 length:441 start_codon:yes stop_codon:yes gene_type:complete
MDKLTKSQKRHQKLKADSEIIPKLFIMIESLTKEVSIIKKKVSSFGDDEWCINYGSYHKDTLYKVKYHNGETQIGYGGNLDWSTFETDLERESERHFDSDASDEPFTSAIESDNYIEYYQLAEIKLSSKLNEKLNSIEELLRRSIK